MVRTPPLPSHPPTQGPPAPTVAGPTGAPVPFGLGLRLGPARARLVIRCQRGVMARTRTGRELTAGERGQEGMMTRIIRVRGPRSGGAGPRPEATRTARDAGVGWWSVSKGLLCSARLPVYTAARARPGASTCHYGTCWPCPPPCRQYSPGSGIPSESGDCQVDRPVGSHPLAHVFEPRESVPNSGWCLRPAFAI
jgi:hypothetical protein